MDSEFIAIKEIERFFKEIERFVKENITSFITNFK